MQNQTLTVEKRKVGRPPKSTTSVIAARRQSIARMLVKGMSQEAMVLALQDEGIQVSRAQVNEYAMQIAKEWRKEIAPEDKQKWIVQLTKQLQDTSARLYDFAFIKGKEGKDDIDYRALDRYMKSLQQMAVLLGVTRGETDTSPHIGNVITLIEINRPDGRQDGNAHVIQGQWHESIPQLSPGATESVG